MIVSFWGGGSLWRLGTGMTARERGWGEVQPAVCRVGQCERLRGRFLPGPVLGHGQELGRLSGEGGGGGTGGAAAGVRCQGGLADGDGRGEDPDLLIGRFLSGTFKFSHLVHCHVFRGEGDRRPEASVRFHAISSNPPHNVLHIACACTEYALLCLM